MCRYPNPYMADRLGTTGPLLISSTNLVRILLGTVSILPKCNYILDRITGSLCSWESGKAPTIFHGTIANELVAKPERTVHAKGGGAHGWFEVTTPVGANYSMASVFSEVGKRTPVTARFSTIAGNLGNADSVRDLRGLAFKYVIYVGIDPTCSLSLFLHSGCARKMESWIG